MIYWRKLFPTAIAGDWPPHNLGLLALLPCAAQLMVLNSLDPQFSILGGIVSLTNTTG